MRFEELKKDLAIVYLILLEHKEYLIKISQYLLQLILVIIIFYACKEFKFQHNIANDIKTMQNQLVSTALPLTNLLSKSAGNFDINEFASETDNAVNIKPALNYTQQKKTHKLELTLLNPTYSLIDCTGNVLSTVTYPVKINLIWQLMKQDLQTGDQPGDQYELICELYSNTTKLIHKKLLLQNINTVKFRFLEYTEPAGIKFINAEQSNKTNIAAIQIGMLVQSSDHFYSKIRHNWYNIFDERVNFLDRYMHKVIYITAQSNLT